MFPLLNARTASVLIVPAYIIGVAGAFLQISGGTWDVASHTMGIVETFFTIPHLILYAGVGLSLLASLAGLLLRQAISKDREMATVLTGLKVSLVGGLLQLVAGPFDFWWHDTYGFDPHLFTPSHILLIAGIILSGVGMAIGATRLLQPGFLSTSLGGLGRPFVLTILTVVAFATLWLDLNGLVYLVTDVDGLNYTFHFGQTWAEQAYPVQFVILAISLAAVGGLMVLTAKRTLGWTGAVSAVTLLVATVVASANLGFRAWYMANSASASMVTTGGIIASFIPLQLFFVAPVVLFDLVVSGIRVKKWAVVGSALVAPFASYLDGFYSLILWTNGTENAITSLPASRIIIIGALFLPMLVAGGIAAVYQSKFAGWLLPSRLKVSLPKPASTS